MKIPNSCRHIKTLGGSLFTSLVVLCFSAVLFAQGVEYTKNSADQTLRSSGRVNPSTFAMEIDIPLAGFPGLGIDVPVSVSYSSKVWRMDYQNQYSRPFPSECGTLWDASFSDDSASGWTSSLGIAYIEYTGKQQIYTQNGSPVDSVCVSYQNPDGSSADETDNSYIKRIQVHLPNGASHELRASDDPVFYPKNTNPVINMDGIYYSVDGSNLKYVENAGTKRLYLPDGSYYDFSSNETYLKDMPIRKATLYKDIHGNQLTFYEGNATYPNGYWMDTLNRTIPVPLPFEPPTGAGTMDYQIPGFGGGLRTYKFYWKKLKDTTAVESALTNFSDSLKYVGDSQGFSGSTLRPAGEVLFHSGIHDSPTPNMVRDVLHGTTGNAALFNPVLLTAVELPNGQKYEFSYNIYGEIDLIKYPSGGYEDFQYDKVPAIGNEYNDENKPGEESERGIKQRNVYESSGAAPLTWTYLTYPVRTVVAPDGTKTERYIIGGVPPCPECGRGTWGFGSILTGRIAREVSYAGTGQPINETKTTWEKTDHAPVPLPSSVMRRPIYPQRHPRVTKVEAIAYDLSGSAVSSTTTMDYAGNLTDLDNHLDVSLVKQYGYTTTIGGLGTLEKQIETLQMEHDASFTNWTNYKNNHIIGLPTQTLVKNAAGTVVAKSEIKYDETNYGSGGFRGQPTTVRNWIENSSWIETRAKYDSAGNVVETTDGRGSKTTIEYSSDYSYAYPTKVTTPAPGNGTYGSNAGLVTQTTYDPTTGLPVSVIDANGQTTLMQYNDPLLRPTKVTAPNGQQTITEYGAGTSEATRYVKVKTQITASNWNEGYSFYDGLGRTVKTQSVKASGGDVFTLSCYDSYGRPDKTSNPFRNVSATSCSSTNLEWTKNVYDAVSRVKEIITPDGAKVQTDYSVATTGNVGMVATVTDQASKQRRSITNALGQLTRVDEPDPVSGSLGTITAPIQPTYYSYDTLGNLTSVQQNGTTAAQCGGATASCSQTRSFVYDALSRLKSATNPESGTISYVYDNNGNLTTKTDARGITTVYTYDKLNRLTYRDYSDATLDAAYFYDGTGLSEPAANAIGRLNRVYTTGSETQYLSFDVMGRIKKSRQITKNYQFNFSDYSYDLAGNLTSQTYPSQKVIQTAYNADGELASVKTPGVPDKIYLDQITRTAAGMIEKMRLGNGRWESAQFNSRLQPTQIALGTNENGTDLLKLNFAYGTTDNNGNVQSQTITAPGLTATQTYNYDYLNRIKSASETGAGNWQQTFTYDRYGNRRFDTNNTTTLGSCNPNVCNPTISPANNRIDASGYIYDTAGNMTSDAELQAFTYDAENKQTQVVKQGVTLGEYFYDGDGKRVRKVSGGVETLFIYNAFGQLAAEYSTQMPQTPRVSYLTTDHLGSTRVVTDQNGVAVSRHDYRPFGEEISRTNYGSDEVRQKFTTYERDDETNLDFAQARMYSYLYGRFTSVDPLMASAKDAIPQSWNRYAYALNNPILYIDPSGELWVRNTGKDSGSNPYLWVDKCGEGQTCYSAVSAYNGSIVRIYGSYNSSDITDYQANEYGQINIDELAKHHDSWFSSVAQEQNIPEPYLSTRTAALLFNVARSYGLEYPNDGYLIFANGNMANGQPCKQANGTPCHSGHRGNDIDLRYMSSKGTSIHASDAYKKADVGRTKRIIELFKANGFPESYTGDTDKFGSSPAGARTEKVHYHHLHIGQFENRPSQSKPKSKK